MKIAVVVLNWNGLHLLQEYLPILEAHSKEATLWVIDNGSTDTSLTYIKNHHPAIQCIALAENYGFAGGYNKGLKQISADVYCLINSDIKVQQNWLNPIVEHFLKFPNTAAVQPYLLDLKKPDFFEYAGAAGGEIDALGYAFCRGRVFTDLEQNTGQYKSPEKIMWASGACLFVRSQVFWECEGFDPLFFAHQEEIDLCWRMHHKGYDIMALGEVPVYHLGGGTLAISPQKTYLNFRNALFLLYKNLPQNKVFATLFTRMILDGIAGVFHVLKGQPNHCLSIIKAHFSFYQAIFKRQLKRPKIIKPYPYKVWSVVYSYFIQKKKKYTDVVKN